MEKPNKGQKLQKQRRDSQSEKIEELTNTIRHLQADFENYQKRVARDQDEFKSFAKRQLILDLLPIIDSFDLALKGLQEKEEKSKEFVKGIELIHAQLASFLEKQNVTPINSLNIAYDPAMHQALMVEETKNKKKTEIVIEEFQKGYVMNGKVIRHAKVKIAK